MKFRKKPVVIEAYQFNNYAGSLGERPRWLLDAIDARDVSYEGGPRPCLTIATLEGDMRAAIGDWIIRGVKGEIYPCRPDIFAETYEPADASPATREGESQ